MSKALKVIIYLHNMQLQLRCKQYFACQQPDFAEAEKFYFVFLPFSILFNLSSVTNHMTYTFNTSTFIIDLHNFALIKLLS